MTKPLEDQPTSPYIKHEDEQDRGRPRSRSHDKDSQSDGLGDNMAGDGDANGDNSSNSEGPARKRRRSRKGLDKKFECTEIGCGKSYSRAEHLHRHQLNHSPKQIYVCDYPGCERHFVRLDLCNRHRDRHTAKGSSLNRKDTLPSQSSPTQESRPGFIAPGSASPESNRPGSGYNQMSSCTPSGRISYSPKLMSAASMPFPSVSGTPKASAADSGLPLSVNGTDYTPRDSAPSGPSPAYTHSSIRPQPVQQHSSYHSPSDRQLPSMANVNSYTVASPVTSQQPPFRNQNPVTSTPQKPYFVPTQNFPPFSLPPSDYVPPPPASVPRDVSSVTSSAFGNMPRYGQGLATRTSTMTSTTLTHDYDAGPEQSNGEVMAFDQMSMTNMMPMFGSDSMMQKSPYVGMPEDFIGYLFNSPNEGSPMASATYSNYNVLQYTPSLNLEAAQLGCFPTAPQQIMSVTNLVDQNLPNTDISEDKSLEIFDLIKERFHEAGHSPVDQRKDFIMEGDRTKDSHILSRKMMQAYILSYWLHFSDQVPILHGPSFSPDRTPNLLLISIMTIGAACLDKAYGQKLLKAGADLSNFLAWNLRWEVFMDPKFRPPAELWVFQTLLLLELYEKMYSTRELHERAHIHHATTIALMRRGRSFMGKAAMESPPNPRGGSDKEHGSRQSSTSGGSHPTDHWWNSWIIKEATRRTAFAAFVIDSIHATMFGHSTVMLAHEMHLPLPCDEKLWTAKSGVDVGRIEAQLQSEGIKPIAFIEGLKRTLSGLEVRTNSFGRTILIAGLLNVSWHMNQRDMQVNSLSMSQALGGRDKWRTTLTRAFDSWKDSFDKVLQGSSPSRHGSGGAGGTSSGGIYPYAYDTSPYGTSQSDVNVVFESRMVLHHLAHMAMHVDVVDLQVYARAKRLLGRVINPQDLSSVQRRMKDVWAKSAKARDATYYALQFLCSVLLRSEGNSPLESNGGYGQGSSYSGSSSGGSNGLDAVEATYSARYDVLLNRPWVLYVAVLVVWSYGHATEGPSPDSTLPGTPQERVQEMREYLHRYSDTIKSPDDLKLRQGLNQNSAMLAVLRESFSKTRWELLHEGAALLTNCIRLNLGQAV